VGAWPTAVIEDGPVRAAGFLQGIGQDRKAGCVEVARRHLPLVGLPALWGPAAGFQLGFSTPFDPIRFKDSTADRRCSGVLAL
jgi:hypothetical protein